MPAVVRAQAFDLTLDPHTLSGSTGQTVTFIGLLENTLGSTAEFTGMTVSLPGFDPDDVSILFDFAGLGDTETRLTDAFSVYINPSVGNGAYYGTLYLDYTYNGGASSGQAVQNFRVNAVPETALIQLPILPALGGAAWWKRRRHAP